MVSKDAQGPNSGIAYKPSAGVAPSDFLTWHDSRGFRVWVHSRFFTDGYKQVAIEVQGIGQDVPAISELELSSRLELAALRAVTEASPTVGPGAFRNIAVGQIIETHSRLIDKHRRKQELAANNKIRIVKKIEVERVNIESTNEPKHKGFAQAGSKDAVANKWTTKNPKVSNLELRATARDSIFIAYVYAEQVKTGSRQAALRTANLLGIEVSLVYVAVRRARKKGWLTSTGTNGQAVGTLTQEGEKEFIKVDGRKMFEHYVMGKNGGLN